MESKYISRGSHIHKGWKEHPVSIRGNKPYWLSFPALNGIHAAHSRPLRRSTAPVLPVLALVLAQRHPMLPVLALLLAVRFAFSRVCSSSVFGIRMRKQISCFVVFFWRSLSPQALVVIQEQFFSSCIFIKAASFGGKDSEAGLQKLCKAMSYIHRRVVRRALLQASRRVVDPEKARRGLLSFRSRKLETKKKKAFVSRGGGLSVSIASKRKREWQGSGVVEEENNDDDSVKPSPLKRCTPPPPKQLPPK